MRILYLTNFYPPVVFGGYEIRCADVVRGLAERGHESLVLTSRHGASEGSVHGHVHRTLHSFWDLPNKPASTDGYLQALREDNQALEKLIREFQPDLISVWNMLGLSYSLARTVQKCDVPALFHIDDTWLLRDDEYWSHYEDIPEDFDNKFIDRQPPRNYPLDCVFISDYRRQNHVDAGLDQKDAPVVYGGIDIDLFDTGGVTLRPDNSTLRLLFAGAFTEAKGAEMPVRALGLLPPEILERIRLTYVGKSSHGAEESLMRLAGELDVADPISFAGSVTREEMPGVYAGHDVFLFPASGPEGFPLVLLEAMASGLAVVTTTDGGHREYIVDGENGLVMTKDDPASLAACIERILADREGAMEMAGCGREQVRERFSIEAMVCATEAVMREVADGKGEASC